MRIRLTGWAAIAALERELRVPPAAVRPVSAGRFEERPWRVLGTPEPLTKALRTVSPGGSALLPRAERRGRPLPLELDPERTGYDVVAISLTDAEQVAAEVAAVLGVRRHAAQAPSHSCHTLARVSAQPVSHTRVFPR